MAQDCTACSGQLPGLPQPAVTTLHIRQDMRYRDVLPWKQYARACPRALGEEHPRAIPKLGCSATTPSLKTQHILAQRLPRISI